MFASLLDRLGVTRSRTAGQTIEGPVAPAVIVPRQLPTLEDAWQGCRLRSSHGTYLALPNSSSLRLVGVPEPDPEQAVILYRSTLRPIAGLLVSPSGRHMDLYGGRLVGPIVPVLIIGLRTF